MVIVRHAREADKSTGTARIAALSLPNSALIDFGEESEPVDAELRAHVDGAWVLFPSDDAAPVPATPPTRLIVLDGTWRQTRRMFRKLPSLAALPRLVLPPKDAAPLRLRESDAPENRSTLEAIADALGQLEGPQVAAPLHAAHALMVERVYRARGVWELKSKSAEASVARSSIKSRLVHKSPDDS